MENWQLVLTLLAALLVGALLPLLMQLYGTLRQVSRLAKEAETLVIETRPALVKAVSEVGASAAHINRVAGALERSEEQVRGLLAAVDGLKEWGGWLKSGAAILTALVSTVLPVVLEALRKSKEQKNHEVVAAAPVSGRSPPNHLEKETVS